MARDPTRFQIMYTLAQISFQNTKSVFKTQICSQNTKSVLKTQNQFSKHEISSQNTKSVLKTRNLDIWRASKQSTIFVVLHSHLYVVYPCIIAHEPPYQTYSSVGQASFRRRFPHANDRTRFRLREGLAQACPNYEREAQKSG